MNFFKPLADILSALGNLRYESLYIIAEICTIREQLYFHVPFKMYCKIFGRKNSCTWHAHAGIIHVHAVTIHVHAVTIHVHAVTIHVHAVTIHAHAGIIHVHAVTIHVHAVTIHVHAVTIHVHAVTIHVHAVTIQALHSLQALYKSVSSCLQYGRDMSI